MYIIITYDVKVKIVSRCLKICRKYLIHVQKSVFECSLTNSQLYKLENELKKLLNPNEHSVCIYCMDSLQYTSKIQFGISSKNVLLLLLNNCAES